MSEIDYFTIEEDLATILKNDSTLKAKANGGELGNQDLFVDVEEPFAAMSDRTPLCGIYLDSWETNPEDERIAAGTKFLTRLNLELWLWEFALDSKEGARLRDRLSKKVKEVLRAPANRKINNSVQITTFQGGDFDNAKEKRTGTGGGTTGEIGFFKGVSIKLQVEVFE